MMPIPNCIDTATSALLAAGAKVEVDSGDLRFALRNGRLIIGQVTLDDHWLTIGARAADMGTIGNSRWPRLVRNGELKGPVRFAVDALGEERLRADVPVDDAAGLSEAVGDVCCELKAAGEEEADSTPREDDGGSGLDGAELEALFGSSGWDVAARDDHLVAALDVPGRFMQARIHARGDNTFRVFVPLLTLPGGLSDVCREALAFFLLGVSNAARLSSPIVFDRDGKTHIGLAVQLRAGTDPGCDLGRALSALSIAAGLCVQEVRALTHERVSAVYLAVRAAGVNGEETH